MGPAIAVRNIEKVYGTGPAALSALRGVNLDVHAGEVIMLIGPSGSGKTTLISILGCILCPTRGSVRINGREVADLNESELPKVRLDHIGFVFQGCNLFPTLSAGENVEIALDLKGIRGATARKRATELMDQVGLGDKWDVFPADLSGGQKQRVAIARALAGDPEIVLADEPTAALDSASGRTVMEMLRDLAWCCGRAVVVVTHDSRVLDYADRIVHIEDGRIMEGKSDETHAYVRSHIPAGVRTGKRLLLSAC